MKCWDINQIEHGYKKGYCLIYHHMMIEVLQVLTLSFVHVIDSILGSNCQLHQVKSGYHSSVVLVRIQQTRVMTISPSLLDHANVASLSILGFLNTFTQLFLPLWIALSWCHPLQSSMISSGSQCIYVRLAYAPCMCVQNVSQCG